MYTEDYEQEIDLKGSVVCIIIQMENPPSGRSDRERL